MVDNWPAEGHPGAPAWATIGVFVVCGLVAAHRLSGWAATPWVFGGTHCDASGPIMACTGYPPVGLLFILAVSIVAAVTVIHNYRIWRDGEAGGGDKTEARDG